MAIEAFRSPARKGSIKGSDRAITPSAEAAHVPAHLAPPGSQQAKKLHDLPTQLPWGRAATGKKKKKIVPMYPESLRWYLFDDSLQPCRLACQVSLSGGFPLSKNTGAYWPILIAIPFSVQFSSVAQSCPTRCDPMNRSTPGLPVHHHLPASESFPMSQLFA